MHLRSSHIMIFDPLDPRLMISPTEDELQDFLILCVCVAGKKASIQRQKVTSFLSQRNGLAPFDYLKKLGPSLEARLKEVRIGQYRRITKTFQWLASNVPDLTKCTLDEIEQIPGIGPKTSRFFMLYARNQVVAVLDRHVMRWLNELGYKDAPLLTPSKKDYPKWEKIFLEEAEKRKINPLELDTEVWLQGSGY